MCLIKVYKINLELFPYPHKNRLVTMQLAENTIEKLKVMTKTNCYFESPIFNLEMAENKSQNLKLLPYTHFQNRIVTIQLDKNTMETKLLPIEMIYEPKGTMANTPRKIQLQ